jgi:hypothetical protein
MCDMSFRADHEADRDPEDSLEPSREEFIKSIIVDFFDEVMLIPRKDCSKLADKLIDELNPYCEIKEN